MALRKLAIFGCALLLGGALGAAAAHAELLVTGNDAHEPPAAGETPGTAADSLAVIDFASNGTLKLLGTVEAGASVIGPPNAAWISRDEKWALISSGTRRDPADPAKTVTDDVVFVVDLSTPARPRILQTLHAGQGVSSIAVNRAGTMMLTSDTNDDTVSVFTIAGNRLTPAGKLKLDQGARPYSITFLPDGSGALLQANGPGLGVLKLTLNGTTLTNNGPFGGLRGSTSAISRDGKYAAINAIPAPAPTPGAAPAPGRGRGRGPATPPQGSLLDLATGQVAATFPLGPGPEGLTFSQDGTLLAATITNGSHSPPTSPAFNDFGLLRLYKVSGSMVTPVAEAHTGHWCQGTVISGDNRTVLVQCATEKAIQVFRYDGNATLTHDEAADLKFGAAPASMATATSR
jgi:DNA-binding beta-propeller fold protein YncE